MMLKKELNFHLFVSCNRKYQRLQAAKIMLLLSSSPSQREDRAENIGYAEGKGINYYASYPEAKSPYAKDKFAIIIKN